MAITHTDKTISEQKIGCDGTFDVTLSITAEPDGACGTADVALVLDRSGSMAGAPMDHLKAGAKEFIARVLGSRQGAAGGSRIGVVSFDGSASTNVSLTGDAAALRAAVDALNAQGSTNHSDAFSAAGALLSDKARRRVLVIFTDGETTVGGDPAPVARSLRDKGVEIYCVGLVGRTGLDEATLCSWGSAPSDRHVVTTARAEELEKAFCVLAGMIASPGASEIHLRDIVNTDFAIIGYEAPAFGEANVENSQTIHWHIPSLAASCPETATLTFHVQHVGAAGGTKPVNRAIEFTDAAGSDPEFPSPTITVECGSVVMPGCPHTVDVYAPPCADSIFCDAGDISLSDEGRILQVDFTLRGVCPHRRTCVGIIVSELTASGTEESRGFKTLVVPAHDGQACRDIHVMCVSFVLPAPENACGGICAGRHLRVRILANSMDSTWNGCGTVPMQPCQGQ